MTGEGQGSGINIKVVAFAVVAVSLMMALSGYAVILMMEKLNGDDQDYKKSWNYSTSGTRMVESIQYEFTGQGESKYVSEVDGFRTYQFTFTQADSKGSFTMNATFICDSDGVPTDLYKHDGDEGDTAFWTYSESGSDYRFGVRDGRVVSLDITTADTVLKAVIA